MRLIRFLLLFLLTTAVLLPTACTPGQSPLSPTRPAATTTPEMAAAVAALAAELAQTGAAVTQDGPQPQALFDGADALWLLTVDGAAVRVFTFPDAAARQRISDALSPDGSNLTFRSGDTSTTVHMDGIAYPYFWARGALLVNYNGQETAPVRRLTAVLGAPIADGSQSYRAAAPGQGIAGGTFDGISFQYDPWLAAGAQPARRPAVSAADAAGFIYAIAPPHLAISLTTHYAADWPLLRQAANLPAAPTLLVFPAAAYAEVNELAATRLRQLRQILAERPSTLSDPPLLPPPNGAAALVTRVAYLDFQNGRGVRYLTQINQETRAVNNQELLYVFQGLTDDNAFLVTAIFPVQQAALPANGDVADPAAFAAARDAYLAETRLRLTDAAPTSFTPDLALLDAVARSLHVPRDLDLAPPPPTPAPTPPPILVDAQPIFTGGSARLLGWSPNGRYLAYFEHTADQLAASPGIPGTAEGTFTLYDAETGEKCQRYPLSGLFAYEGAGRDTRLLWLPDGSLLLVTQDGRFLHAAQPCGQDTDLTARFPDAITGIHSLSPDGRRLLLTGRAAYLLADLATWDSIAIPEITPDSFNNLAWSPDGAYLAVNLAGNYTGDRDPVGGTRVVDTATGAIVARSAWEPANALDGSFGGPEWMSHDEFLVTLSLDQGPFFMNVAGQIRPLLPLFGLDYRRDEMMPSATVYVDPATGAAHVLLRDFGWFGPGVPPVIYHAASGEVEALPADDYYYLAPNGTLYAGSNQDRARAVALPGDPFRPVGGPCHAPGFAPQAPIFLRVTGRGDDLELYALPACRFLATLRLPAAAAGQYVGGQVSPDGRWLALVPTDGTGLGQALYVVSLADLPFRAEGEDS